MSILESTVDRVLQLENDLKLARDECAQMRLSRDAALEQLNLRSQVLLWPYLAVVMAVVADAGGAGCSAGPAA